MQSTSCRIRDAAIETLPLMTRKTKKPRAGSPGLQCYVSTILMWFHSCLSALLRGPALLVGGDFGFVLQGHANFVETL
jgi:hypothetical protein